MNHKSIDLKNIHGKAKEKAQSKQITLIYQQSSDQFYIYSFS
jgi:hypothetical protein